MVPEGHEVVNSLWLKGLQNEHETMRKMIESKEQVNAQPYSPEEAQHMIVELLLSFTPGVSNTVLNQSLTIVKGHRVAAIKERTKSLQESEARLTQAQANLNEAKLYDTGFDNAIAASSAPLH